MKTKRLLTTMALAVGMTLQAQTHEFVIQTKKWAPRFSPPCTDSFSRTSTMRPTEACMPNW